MELSLGEVSNGRFERDVLFCIRDGLRVGFLQSSCFEDSLLRVEGGFDPWHKLFEVHLEQFNALVKSDRGLLDLPWQPRPVD